ncbi:unnamed protein product, partial [Vitis vinifera]
MPSYLGLSGFSEEGMACLFADGAEASSLLSLSISIETSLISVSDDLLRLFFWPPRPSSKHLKSIVHAIERGISVWVYPRVLFPWNGPIY